MVPSLPSGSGAVCGSSRKRFSDVAWRTDRRRCNRSTVGTRLPHRRPKQTDKLFGVPPVTNVFGSPDKNNELMRARLAAAAGPRFWQSIDELADTEEFQRFLRSEFP